MRVIHNSLSTCVARTQCKDKYNNLRWLKFNFIHYVAVYRQHICIYIEGKKDACHYVVKEAKVCGRRVSRGSIFQTLMTQCKTDGCRSEKEVRHIAL